MGLELTASLPPRDQGPVGGDLLGILEIAPRTYHRSPAVGAEPSQTDWFPTNQTSS